MCRVGCNFAQVLFEHSLTRAVLPTMRLPPAAAPPHWPTLPLLSTTHTPRLSSCSVLHNCVTCAAARAPLFFRKRTPQQACEQTNAIIQRTVTHNIHHMNFVNATRHTALVLAKRNMETNAGL
jgi:hypothetical protein